MIFEKEQNIANFGKLPDEEKTEKVPPRRREYSADKCFCSKVLNPELSHPPSLSILLWIEKL